MPLAPLTPVLGVWLMRPRTQFELTDSTILDGGAPIPSDCVV